MAARARYLDEWDAAQNPFTGQETSVFSLPAWVATILGWTMLLGGLAVASGIVGYVANLFHAPLSIGALKTWAQSVISPPKVASTGAKSAAAATGPTFYT